MFYAISKVLAISLLPTNAPKIFVFLDSLMQMGEDIGMITNPLQVISSAQFESDKNTTTEPEEQRNASPHHHQASISHMKAGTAFLGPPAHAKPRKPHQKALTTAPARQE
jgi:hypothetical protein